MIRRKAIKPMATFWKMWRAWFVGVPILLIVVGSVVFLSPSFESCRDENGANQTSVLQLKTIVRCTNTFIDSSHDSITAIATVFIALFTITLWWASAGQYDLIEQQIKLARDDFSATHRPWVPITNVEPYSGLSWAQGNALIGLTIFCRNTGNSPAQRVSLRAAIFPFLSNENIPIEIENLKKRPLDKESRALIERTLFPDTPNDLQMARVLLIRDTEISQLKDRFGGAAEEMIPVILGCIEYYFSFGDPVPHYTPFAYHVWRTHRTEPSSRLALPVSGQNIDARDIVLVDLINAGDPT